MRIRRRLVLLAVGVATAGMTLFAVLLSGLLARGVSDDQDQALQRLPQDQQEVLYLAAYEDWSVARIAEYLSLTEATVRGRLYRARQGLRQFILLEEDS